jgi:uncharacterized protein YkwD
MSRTTPLARTRLTILAAVAALLLLAAGPMAHPTPTYAGTASSTETQILALVNRARANRGLAPLRLRASLVDFAGDRAAKMARTGILKHPACLPCKLDRRGISYSTYGETIAWTFKPLGERAATHLFRIWKNSPPHWALLMSSRLDRVGVGVAHRSNGSNWSAVVLTG